MEKKILRKLAVTCALVCGVTASFTKDSYAQNRPSGRISIKTRQSTLQSINAQSIRHCNLPGVPQNSCWTKAEYVEHARQQGWIDSNNQIVDHNQSEVAGSGGDFIWVPGGQWNVDFVLPPQQPPNRNTPQPQRPEKRIALGVQSKIKDPSTGGELNIDGATKAGREFARAAAEERAQAAAIAGATASHVQNFLEKERQFEQQRERFENHLRQANAESRLQLEELRQYTAQVNAASAASRNQGLVEVARGLLSSGMMTSEERTALSEAEKLAASDLRSVEYSLDEGGAKILERDLARFIAAGNYQAAAKTLEILENASVDGHPRVSKVTRKYTNPSGILKVGGLFDQRSLQVSSTSQEGQIVRRLMNRYQAMWAESNGLSVLPSEDQARYILGAVALSVGEGVLAGGDSLRGAAMMELSEVMIESVMGFGVGFGKSVEDLVRSVPEIAKLVGQGANAVWSDPVAAWSATIKFASDLDEVGAALLVAVNKDYELLQGGTARERGEVLGRYAIDIVSIAVSGGTISVIKNAGKAGRIGELVTSAAKASEVTKVLARTEKIPGLVRATQVISTDIMEATLEKVKHMPGAGKRVLAVTSGRAPELVQNLSQLYVGAIRGGKAATARYLEKLAALYDVRSPSLKEIHFPKDVKNVVKLHDDVVELFKTQEGVEANGWYSRGSRAERVTDEGVKKISDTDVLTTFPGNATDSGRFTIGGELGDKGIHFSKGRIDEAKDLIVAETRVTSADVLLFRELDLKVGNLLDLRNRDLLNKISALNPNVDVLTKGSYEYTHALGHAARSAGFDGILYESARKARRTNLVIFQ